MRGIYLAAFKANHPNHDLVYQDIDGKRDIGGDMMEVDLAEYDYIIATPPCNYYSRANYRRETSAYAQATKHLLPSILNKLIALGKPFIVENVKNKRIFKEIGLLDLPCYIYLIGRHTYWSNVKFKYDDIEQHYDFRQGGYLIRDCQNYSRGKRQGGENVHVVIERFIQTREGEYNGNQRKY